MLKAKNLKGNAGPLFVFNVPMYEINKFQPLWSIDEDERTVNEATETLNVNSISMVFKIIKIQSIIFFIL